MTASGFIRTPPPGEREIKVADIEKPRFCRIIDNTAFNLYKGVWTQLTVLYGPISTGTNCDCASTLFDRGQHE